MHTIAILPLNLNSRATSHPMRMGGAAFRINRAEAQSRKGLRALIRDILDMISNGSIEGGVAS